MTSKQCFKIKSFIVDVNNCLNGIFPWFDTLNRKISPGSRLIDSFSSHFSFYQENCKDKESKTVHLWELNKIIFKVLSSTNMVIVISNASIKNNIATSITHVHSFSNLIKKTLHHTIYITKLKPNYLWSDTELVRLSKSLISPISSSSLMLFI